MRFLKRVGKAVFLGKNRASETNSETKLHLPTLLDVHYGPHERQVLDFYKAKKHCLTLTYCPFGHIIKMIAKNLFQRSWEFLFPFIWTISCLITIEARASEFHQASICEFGAVSDGVTVNTQVIQQLIDEMAKSGGGTVVIPKGEFVCGALFMKAGVNLHLEEGSVLRCSSNRVDFPGQRTRIEGHFEENFTPALINASGIEGFRISGKGTLDGAGRPIWDLFWKQRKQAADYKNFPNISIPRARLVILEKCTNVSIDGITFKDSQFWNLHLYKCRDVIVQNATFKVPDDYERAPSTDGIDIDSSTDVVYRGMCVFRN